MLVEYYFKIKYIKGTDNIRVDVFSRKVELIRNLLSRLVVKLVVKSVECVGRLSIAPITQATC